MALVKARKTYGNTEIGGHATVQLGDKHTQNDIHLASVNTLQIFAINNELDLSQIVDVARRKRLRDTDEHDGRCSCAAKRGRKEDFLMIGNDTTKKDYDHNTSPVPEALPTAQPISKQEHLEFDRVISQLTDHDGPDENIEELPHTSEQAVVVAQDLQPILPQQTKSTLQEIYHLATARVLDKQPSTDQKLHFSKLLADFSKAMYTPLIKRVLQFHSPQQEFDVAPVKCHDTQLITKIASGPLQDMAAAFVAILSFLACDHSGGNDSSKALISAQNGRKIPLIGALIAFAVARCLCFPQMARAISELSGDCLVLEDAFRVEQRIPMSHCENFSLLKALLTHRLAGSTAEAFLNATQFNLALGSRSGPLIHNNDWSVKGRITKKHRVVMAVYLKKSDTKCMDCQSNLVMKDTGEFLCYPCGRFFRNCASLSYLAAFAKKKQATRILASALSPSQPTGGKEGSKPSSRIREVEEEEEDSFDLDGLKNIDLRILPRRPAKRQPISVESELESTSQPSNSSGDWSETEVELFYDAVARVGLDFDQLAQFFETKTPSMIHEYFTRLINSSSSEEFHKVADISNKHILGELKQGRCTVPPPQHIPESLHDAWQWSVVRYVMANQKIFTPSEDPETIIDTAQRHASKEIDRILERNDPGMQWDGRDVAPPVSPSLQFSPYELAIDHHSSSALLTQTSSLEYQEGRFPNANLNVTPPEYGPSAAFRQSMQDVFPEGAVFDQKEKNNYSLQNLSAESQQRHPNVPRPYQREISPFRELSPLQLRSWGVPEDSWQVPHLQYKALSVTPSEVMLDYAEVDKEEVLLDPWRPMSVELGSSNQAQSLESQNAYVCRGELNATIGRTWGCGRRFATADALTQHLHSADGRVCMKLLLDEEAAARRHQQAENQQIPLAYAPLDIRQTYDADDSVENTYGWSTEYPPAQAIEGLYTRPAVMSLTPSTAYDSPSQRTFLPQDLWQMPMTDEWDRAFDNPHAPTTCSEPMHQSYIQPQSSSQSPLQDYYQTQSMPFEYQNKTRLMMARAKQRN